MKVSPIAKINKIIKSNPVPILPSLAIPCEKFSQSKTRENFVNTPSNLPRVNETRNIVANFVYIEINKIKSNELSSCNMLEIYIMWGCVDLKDCFNAGDLSNIASTYIGIIIGALIGGFISWLIYNRQEKTAVIQKDIQDHILNLEEKHEISLEKHVNILEKIQIFEQNHDEMLNKILTLDKKINSLLESK